MHVLQAVCRVYISTGFFTMIWKAQKLVYWKSMLLGLIRALDFLLVTKKTSALFAVQDIQESVIICL